VCFFILPPPFSSPRLVPFCRTREAARLCRAQRIADAYGVFGAPGAGASGPGGTPINGALDGAGSLGDSAAPRRGSASVTSIDFAIFLSSWAS
jgi:hypothetical protein